MLSNKQTFIQSIEPAQFFEKVEIFCAELTVESSIYIMQLIVDVACKNKDILIEFWFISKK